MTMAVRFVIVSLVSLTTTYAAVAPSTAPTTDAPTFIAGTPIIDQCTRSGARSKAAVNELYGVNTPDVTSDLICWEQGCRYAGTTCTEQCDQSNQVAHTNAETCQAICYLGCAEYSYLQAPTTYTADADFYSLDASSLFKSMDNAMVLLPERPDFDPPFRAWSADIANYNLVTPLDCVSFTIKGVSVHPLATVVVDPGNGDSRFVLESGRESTLISTTSNATGRDQARQVISLEVTAQSPGGTIGTKIYQVTLGKGELSNAGGAAGEGGDSVSFYMVDEYSVLYLILFIIGVIICAICCVVFCCFVFCREEKVVETEEDNDDVSKTRSEDLLDKALYGTGSRPLEFSKEEDPESNDVVDLEIHNDEDIIDLEETSNIDLEMNEYNDDMVFREMHGDAWFQGNSDPQGMHLHLRNSPSGNAPDSFSKDDHAASASVRAQREFREQSDADAAEQRLQAQVNALNVEALDAERRLQEQVDALNVSATRAAYEASAQAAHTESSRAAYTASAMAYAEEYSDRQLYHSGENLDYSVADSTTVPQPSPDSYEDYSVGESRSDDTIVEENRVLEFAYDAPISAMPQLEDNYVSHSQNQQFKNSTHGHTNVQTLRQQSSTHSETHSRNQEHFNSGAPAMSFMDSVSSGAHGSSTQVRPAFDRGLVMRAADHHRHNQRELNRAQQTNSHNQAQINTLTRCRSLAEPEATNMVADTNRSFTDLDDAHNEGLLKSSAHGSSNRTRTRQSRQHGHVQESHHKADVETRETNSHNQAQINTLTRCRSLAEPEATNMVADTNRSFTDLDHAHNEGQLNSSAHGSSNRTRTRRSHQHGHVQESHHKASTQSQRTGRFRRPSLDQAGIEKAPSMALDEELARFHDQFQHADANGNGTLNAEEFETLGLDPALSFGQFDVTATGEVTEQELMDKFFPSGDSIPL